MGVCLWVGGVSASGSWGCLPVSPGGFGGFGVGCDDCLWVWVVCLWVRGGVSTTSLGTRNPGHTHTHTPVEVAIEEGGTHPTGMHFCYFCS